MNVGPEQLAEVQTGRLEAVIAMDGPAGECQRFARLAECVLI